MNKGEIQMKLKKIMAVGVAAAMAFTSTAIADNGSITVNGNKIEGTAYDNYLPLREIAEELGFSVEWNGESKSVVLSKLPQYVTMTIGVDGYTFARTAPMPLGAAPIIRDGATYVPAELFSELLEYDVVNEDGDFTITDLYLPHDVVVKEINEDSILIEDSQKGDVILNISEFIEISDEEGNPKSIEDITVGSKLSVVYSLPMTMSIPPINNPLSIVIAEANEETTSEETTEETTEEVTSEETTEEVTTEETTEEITEEASTETTTVEE